MNSLALASEPVPISDAPLLALLIRNRVCAGFPYPAEDLGAKRIDRTQVLITHPQATYFLRASGHSMVEADIFDNDILVVDRAIKPRNNHIVVAVVDGDAGNLQPPKLNVLCLQESKGLSVDELATHLAPFHVQRATISALLPRKASFN
jgi:hypothetical protein